MRSYVIHLEQSVDREPVVEALFESLPNPRILSAVDGRKMPEAQRQALITPHLFKPSYPFALLPAEIGVFQSHRKAWQALVQSGDDAAFVAEDDIALDPAVFPTAREAAIAALTPDRLIRFPIKKREVADEFVSTTETASVFRPKVIALSAGLYLIGRTAAERALEATHKIDRPVDTMLQMRWETGIDTLVAWPSGAQSVAIGAENSTVQSKTSAFQELQRVVRRASYRAQIRHLSQKSLK